jgi:hypothetical protein
MSGLLVFCGYLIGANKDLQDDRLARMERYQSDARWNLLIEYGKQLADLGGAVRRHEDQLKELKGMAYDIKIIRGIAEAEAKRKTRGDRGGGYGL